VILITRPYKQAIQTALTFEREGFKTCVEPLLSITQQPVNFKYGPHTHLLITSANALENKHIPLHLPALCVGEASAAYARQKGFTHVITPPLTHTRVEEILPWFMAQHQHFKGDVLYLRGRDVTVDVKAFVEGAGIPYREAVVYEAAMVSDWPTPTTQALITGYTVKAITFYSKRTVQAFCHVVSRSRLEATLPTLTALSLSPAITQVLKALPFGRVITASTTAEIIAKLRGNTP
jgi:uroporphyrinogen-III synthase